MGCGTLLAIPLASDGRKRKARRTNVIPCVYDCPCDSLCHCSLQRGSVVTKKDFIAMAQIVNEAKLSKAAKLNLAIALANWLQTQNPRFDRDKFIDACTGF
jgi:hypothetical protein